MPVMRVSAYVLMQFVVVACAVRVPDSELAPSVDGRTGRLWLEVRRVPEVALGGEVHGGGEVAVCNGYSSDVELALGGAFLYSANYLSGERFTGGAPRGCSDVRVIPSGGCVVRGFVVVAGSIYDLEGRSFGEEFVVLVLPREGEVEVELAFVAERIVGGECIGETISGDPDVFPLRVSKQVGSP